MDSFDTDDHENIEKRKLTEQIHRTLAHSYFFFFACFLFGVVLHTFYPIQISQSGIAPLLGFLFLLLATFLIFWAQYTSRQLKHESPTVQHFLQGPYTFTRNPTHWGLFLLLLSFGAIVNSRVISVIAILAFCITKAIFIRKEEAALLKKYGAPYREYQKRVRL